MIIFLSLLFNIGKNFNYVSEHMLFLGTKKYPEENHYSKFIKTHGGLKNAATGEDYTHYHFDVKNE